MLCAVYKSSRKLETYLYVLKRDDFSSVPEALMKTFGTPQLVTLINLANRDKLGIADIDKLKTNLSQHGFYLQLPPPTEDLLKQHRIDAGVEDV
ncbi:YcgL domain-containing protein [Thalassotalea nanhaiensis]|uniref:YcgL domain-containing protein RI845_12185 n=1 Tax=Thalassotalea nanhaiensis TaxID=3065648 RepID=A0ABY9TEQ9_9GAMM|nr:YcgL domain-containing protein [Colwelliaceae bacterium SQ345]